MGNETFSHSDNVTVNEEYIFNRTDVKVIFIILYTVVFVPCFLGNMMVILVVTFSRRLRSNTNFFLANLALADFCVGIFCIYQTLFNYLINSWLFGDFLCKLYMFVHAFSYTASVLILVVVCVERYLAIVYPIKCRSVLTRSRLQMVIGLVWTVAAIYASPRFFYVETLRHFLNTGGMNIICVGNVHKHNKKLVDAVNLVFLYLFPLVLMCCLYLKLGVGLWKSSAALVPFETSNFFRMLIAMVTIFAVCNLPQQARIAWRIWGYNYDLASNFSTLLTLSTFLISYLNSCLNPLLYAFLSRNFQRGMRELLIRGKQRQRSNVLAMVYTKEDTTSRQVLRFHSFGRSSSGK
ncbi:Galanin receptor type 2 [Habropoda laboriosa]|uniref:Galanin receptor type 2 n=1 Tax=Habropoda laboriosa TaxID=597456 RepID=A0A0L7RA71_9HYME|nr:Galanin receptor type 2 [Habropoda laboriosa]